MLLKLIFCVKLEVLTAVTVKIILSSCMRRR